MKKSLKQKITIDKPWGRFEQFTKQQPVTVKIIIVYPNESLSLQYHKQRQEFWKILSGSCEVTIGDSVYEAGEGDEYFVDKKEKHRIRAKNNQVKVLEISFGHFDESDIVRLEDKYQRHK